MGISKWLSMRVAEARNVFQEANSKPGRPRSDYPDRFRLSDPLLHTISSAWALRDVVEAVIPSDSRLGSPDAINRQRHLLAASLAYLVSFHAPDELTVDNLRLVVGMAVADPEPHDADVDICTPIDVLIWGDNDEIKFRGYRSWVRSCLDRGELDAATGQLLSDGLLLLPLEEYMAWIESCKGSYRLKRDSAQGCLKFIDRSCGERTTA